MAAVRRGLLALFGNALAFAFTVVIGMAVGCALSIGDTVDDPWAEEKRRSERSSDDRR